VLFEVRLLSLSILERHNDILIDDEKGAGGKKWLETTVLNWQMHIYMVFTWNGKSIVDFMDVVSFHGASPLSVCRCFAICISFIFGTETQTGNLYQ